MASFPTFPLIEEQSDGLAEGCNEQGPWGRRVYLLPWSQRWAFNAFLKGSSSTTGASAPWVRIRPAPYPVALAGGQIYAKDVSWLGEGAPVTGTDPLDYTHARITVSWGPLELGSQASVDDPFFLNEFSADPAETPLLDGTTQELDYSAEYTQVPQGSYNFESDGKKIDSPMNMRIGVTHLNIVWNRFPRLPLSRVRDYADSVNDATFLGGARGTVMFSGGIKTRRQLDTDGKITQQVSMSLKWRKKGWNQFIRPDTGNFDVAIRNNVAGEVLYPYKDFRILLLL